MNGKFGALYKLKGFVRIILGLRVLRVAIEVCSHVEIYRKTWGMEM